MTQGHEVELRFATFDEIVGELERRSRALFLTIQLHDDQGAAVMKFRTRGDRFAAYGGAHAALEVMKRNVELLEGK